MSESKANNPEDLTGQVFKDLTVIKRIEPQGTQKVCRWLVKCQCGNERVFKASELASGQWASCGKCDYFRRTYMIDITGQRFGKLVALYKLKKSKYTPYNYWQCLCDCGREYAVYSASLRNGYTWRCDGCRGWHEYGPRRSE